MNKLLSMKQFYGLNTMKRKPQSNQASSMQDMISERGLTRTRSGFGKYNTTAQSGGILGIFDYKRKNGQKGFLVCDANGDIWDWEQFHYDPDDEPNWWDDTYEAEVIPPWIVQGYDSDNSVSNGILTIKPLTDESGYRKNNVGNLDGTILEVRMKVISLVHYFSIAIALVDGGTIHRTYINVYDHMVTDHHGTPYVMNTTSAFHTYRLESKNDKYEVYVDGILRHSGNSQPTTPVNDVTHIYFGIWYAQSAEAQVDYARYYTGGF